MKEREVHREGGERSYIGRRCNITIAARSKRPSAEGAGLSTFNEGQQLDYEMVANRGKESAENLKVR